MPSKVMKVSYSQVQTFLRCRKKWHYNYIRGLIPVKENEAMQLGDYIHGKLDIYYQLRQQTEDALDLWEMMQMNIVEDAELGKNPEFVARCIKMMKRYILHFAPVVDRGMEVIATEYGFQVELMTPKGRPFILEGYADLIYKRGDYIFERDHKTTGKPGNFRTKEMEIYDPQQTTYIAGLRAHGIDVTRGEVSTLITYDYAKYQTEPLSKVMKLEPTFRGGPELDACLTWYGTVVDQMYDEVEYLRSLEMGCRFCWYKNPCLYSLRGTDEEPIIELAFKHKDGWTEHHADTPRS